MNNNDFGLKDFNVLLLRSDVWIEIKGHTQQLPFGAGLSSISLSNLSQRGKWNTGQIATASLWVKKAGSVTGCHWVHLAVIRFRGQATISRKLGGNFIFPSARLKPDRLQPGFARILGQFLSLLRSYLSTGSCVLLYFPEYVFAFLFF